jgi:hypothetical protein
MTRHDMTPDIRADQDDPLVQAAVAPSEFAAQTKAAVLQDEGIEAFVFSAERSWTGGLGISPSGAGVPVWVRKSTLERAQQTLQQRIADSVDLDWDEVDVGEPEQVNARSAPSKLLKVIVILGWLVAAAGILLSLYYFGWMLG